MNNLEPKERKELPDVFNTQEELLARLNKVVEDLAVRLVPVMREPIPVASGEVKTARSYSSPIANDVDGKNERIIDSIDRLQLLIERLEL